MKISIDEELLKEKLNTIKRRSRSDFFSVVKDREAFTFGKLGH